jgi:hypothetical protein
MISARLAEANAPTELSTNLLEQMDARFEKMTQPCIEAIGRKLTLKLSENVQVFR